MLVLIGADDWVRTLFEIAQVVKTGDAVVAWIPWAAPLWVPSDCRFRSVLFSSCISVPYDSGSKLRPFSDYVYD